MPDLDRIKSNVAKMASMKAPESDIDGYISSEGVSLDDVKNHTIGDKRGDIEKQIFKGLYETVPFGKRIVKSLVPQDASLIEKTSEPKGIGQNIARMAGSGLGYAPSVATGEALAGDIPKFVAGAIGAGTQSVGKAQSEGKKGLEPLKEGLATTGGIVVGGKILDKSSDLLINKSLGSLPDKVSNKIHDLYNYAIGTKLKNIADVVNAKSNRVTAIKTIHENIPNIKLQNQDTMEMESRAPINRLELLHALKQTKLSVWDKVSELSQGATNKKALIDLPKIAESSVNDAKKKIGRVALQSNPQLSQGLDKALEQIKLVGKVNPKESEEYMKWLFSETQRLKNSGQAVDFSVKDLYSDLLGKLNEETDSTIEKSLGESGYKDLRRQYASLKSSEKEILGAANKFNRTAGSGGPSHPFVNLWSLEDILQGAGDIAIGSPVSGATKIARGTMIKGASKLSDYLTSPDKRISEMFKLIDRNSSSKSSMLNNLHGDLGSVGQLSAEPMITKKPSRSLYYPKTNQKEWPKIQGDE